MVTLYLSEGKILSIFSFSLASMVSIRDVFTSFMYVVIRATCPVLSTKLLNRLPLSADLRATSIMKVFSCEVGS